jgi:large subunit ribosomal protein L9
MKVILKKDIKSIGIAGTVKNVSDGYARNYLIPQGIAAKATAPAMRQLENEKKAYEKKRLGELGKHRALAEKLTAAVCSLTVKTGEDNKMFGSVTTAMISEQLKTLGFDIDKHDIVLGEALKTIGDHTIDVRIDPEVHAKLKVTLVAETAPEKEKK